MGVAPGSPVSAGNTNPAFLDANADDTAAGKITLANTDPASGAQVDNIQREHNAASSYTGMPLNSAKDVVPAWTNNDVGTNSDTLKARADLLTQKFNDTTGHLHSGAPGDAPLIPPTNVADVPLVGVYQMGADITGVTGSSSDVSSSFALSQPSTNSTTKGVVVNTPYNRIFIRQASGANQDDEYTDGSGNVVYGRLTNSGVTWTLSYYVQISGTETPYSFGSASDVRYYYQKLFDRIVDAPVYSDLSNIPSDNATADVVDASETQAGKVLLANAAPQSVGNTNDKGSATRVAKADHVHQGVHSVQEYTDATQVYGDIVLKGGPNTTITRTGQQFLIDSLGAIAKQENPAGPVNGVNTTFGPLAYLPSTSDSVLVFLDTVPQVYGVDFTISGQSIIFTTAPVAGQFVYAFYVTAGIPATPPVVTGTFNVEFRTITSLEESNKIIVLANTPVIPGNVIVDIIGGAAQEFNVDYTVVTNQFRWNGYALDGILSAGDKIRFQYIT